MYVFTYLFVTFKDGTFECVRTGISCNITKYLEITAIVGHIKYAINWMI